MSLVQTSDNHLLVLVTLPDPDLARRIARSLVERKLAACAQVIPSIESHYWWKGKLESSQEQLLLIKTLRSNWENLAEAIKIDHPYEVPQIVAVPITHGLQAYLAWVSASVGAMDASNHITPTSDNPSSSRAQQWPGGASSPV